MSADGVYFWANWVLVAALVLGVAATYAIVVSGNIRDKALKLNLATQGTIVAQANERAAEAEARAAEAKLELARFRADRILDAKALDRIVAAVRPFGGMVFDVAFAQGEMEQAKLALQLESVLATAHWNEIDWKGGDIILTRPNRRVVGIIGVRNIVVAYSPHAPELAPAANSLALALSREGLAAAATATNGTSAQNALAIHILIGRKD